jgi:hypothetical protein
MPAGYERDHPPVLPSRGQGEQQQRLWQQQQQQERRRLLQDQYQRQIDHASSHVWGLAAGWCIP